MIVNSSPRNTTQLSSITINQVFRRQLTKHCKRHLSFADLHHLDFYGKCLDCYIVSCQYAFLTHARYLPMERGLCATSASSSARSVGRMSRISLHTLHW